MKAVKLPVKSTLSSWEPALFFPSLVVLFAAQLPTLFLRLSKSLLLRQTHQK
jgi:hypothetical protein